MKQIITNNLATWTTAPKGIKKLRELILELAVRGLLVPQDPNDEPASELLKKIAAEKARLVSEGKIKKQIPPNPPFSKGGTVSTSPSPAFLKGVTVSAPPFERGTTTSTPPFEKGGLGGISETEQPFALPLGWEFCRFSTLINSIISGGTPSKINSQFWDGDIPWASVKDLGKSKYLEKTQDYITQKGLDAGSKLADINDVIICTRMGLGKIAIAKVNVAINQDLKAVKLTSLLNVEFFLNSFATLNIKGTGTTVAGIKQEELLSYLFALPPLAEQQRIVAKVDELMQLCDRLEEKQSGSQAMHRQLVSCLLTTLTEATDAQAFQAAWSQIAANFDNLFTTEHSIEQLKQTILQLAVMGKLVPQNPNDEPASELLNKIATEKANPPCPPFSKGGEKPNSHIVSIFKKDKVNTVPPFGKGGLGGISENEKPFALPDSWEWVRFGSISKLVNGDRGKNYPNRDEYVPEGIPFINTGHIQPDGTLDASNMNFITRDKFNSLNGGKIQAGDILYCLRGATMGKTAFVNQYKEGAIASSLVIIRLDKEVLTEKYAYLFLNSPYGKRLIKQYDNGSAQPNLSANSVTLYISPIPPLEEQHRIVTKVDELLTLCEQLKTKLATAQTLQQQLAETLVQKAVA